MLNNLAFTICSINYLAQAITLGNSLKDSNPEVGFRIYLVDKLKGKEDVKDRIPFTMVEIEDVPVTDFEGMIVRYNITELNTAVKPFIIDYIFKTEADVNNIVYFDPDIMVFGSLEPLKKRLSEYSIVLTPQILSPSNEHPHGIDEKSFLATGVFNLGFLALSRHEETFRFLDWWKLRLIDQCYNNSTLQLFYDQKWLNFAPIFFNTVYIEKDPGYNMAGWNLHERKLTKKNNTYVVNYKTDLVFYHFSSVKVHSDNICEYLTLKLDARPDLKDVIDTYRSNLLTNGNDLFSSYSCYYSKFYRGMTVYYPRFHWVTIYRRTRINLGKLKRLIFKD
ncbi:glycosyltransferase [Pontibacter sp. SGAir0037]|uniref:glycosyltransferase n=1 Tax=Pontibacter sp. SGAir0037 TaxID=2571030 RepID=UPI0010CD68AD|nr:glycosyltransferase [Pontibacter sp. SGAir0037]QCR22178.1 glycosyl transferase [Pontibacter sp. SGAir0037]